MTAVERNTLHSAKKLTVIEHALRLRLIVLRPPPGVQFCLQRGASELVNVVVSTGADISFDLAVRAQPVANGDVARFLGPFTQGPPAVRFLYVCSGTSAGQLDSCWTRRAKIPLTGIAWPLVEQACAAPNARLVACFDGSARDGGPACATVSLLDGGWRLCSMEKVR